MPFENHLWESHVVGSPCQNIGRGQSAQPKLDTLKAVGDVIAVNPEQARSGFRDGFRDVLRQLPSCLYVLQTMPRPDRQVPEKEAQDQLRNLNNAVKYRSESQDIFRRLGLLPLRDPRRGNRTGSPAPRSHVRPRIVCASYPTVGYTGSGVKSTSRMSAPCRVICSGPHALSIRCSAHM